MKLSLLTLIVLILAVAASTDASHKRLGRLVELHGYGAARNSPAIRVVDPHKAHTGQKFGYKTDDCQLIELAAPDCGPATPVATETVTDQGVVKRVKVKWCRNGKELPGHTSIEMNKAGRLKTLDHDD